MNNKLENYKYEFNLINRFSYLMYYTIDNSYYPIIGYIILNQLTRENNVFFELSNDELIDEFSNSLEENEIIIEKNNYFVFKLNKINDETIDYIKLRLKYSLILYKDFKINYKNNEISFIRYYENNDK